MSQLDEVLALGANNTAGEFSLSGDSLAVLFYALDFVQNLNNWRDYADEELDATTVDEIQALVDNATDSLMRPIVTIPVGATMTWHMAAPPDRWLLCNGAMVSKADYPELWALWGETFGGATTDLFPVLNMTEKSPFGHSGFLALNAAGGSLTHTLTTAQIPAHSHIPSNGGNFLVNGGTGTKKPPALCRITRLSHRVNR